MNIRSRKGDTNNNLSGVRLPFSKILRDFLKTIHFLCMCLIIVYIIELLLNNLVFYYD